MAPAVSTVWTSLTDLEVSWIPLTLEEAHGFIRSYAVTLTSDDRRKKRAVEVEEVPGDQTSVSFPGLDSNREYSVSVAAETAAGVGVSSEPVSAPSKQCECTSPYSMCSCMVCFIYSTVFNTHLLILVYSCICNGVLWHVSALF